MPRHGIPVFSNCLFCEKRFRWRTASEPRRFCSRACDLEWRRRESLNPVRFWSLVDTSDGPDACWPWTGNRNKYGYGVISLFLDGKATLTIASRWAYFLIYGVRPGKQWVLHTCDNPPCCNPRHLYLGTPAQNSTDMVRRGRSARGLMKKDTKLSDDAVREIRALYAAGELTHQEIADRYHIHRNSVWRIAAGRRRYHVA